MNTLHRQTLEKLYAIPLPQKKRQTKPKDSIK